MSSLTFSGDTVKASIPKSLYQAIIRVQAEKDVDFERACEIAGELVDPRRNDFEKAVKMEVEKRYKSELMTQVNKSKKTIGDKKYDEGMSLGIKFGKEYYEFPCNNCGKEITLSDNTWKYARKYLSNKFVHTKCPE